MPTVIDQKRCAQQFIKERLDHWQPDMVQEPIQDKLLDIIEAKKRPRKSLPNAR